MILLKLLEWLKSIFFNNSSNINSEELQTKYYVLKYDSNLYFFDAIYVAKTSMLENELSDIWLEFSCESIMDSILNAEHLEYLEIYSNVIEISEEEYLDFKKEGYEDWVETS